MKICLRGCVILVLLGLLSVRPTAAAFKDDVRYTDLVSLLGAGTPTGDGVRVAQVESRLSNFRYAANHPTDPLLTDPELQSKTWVRTGPLDSDISSHARDVAIAFVGDTTSMAPGVSIVDAFDSEQWLLGKSLRTQFASPNHETYMGNSDARVFNHSWIGATNPVDYEFETELLRRLDYVIATHDRINVVGLNDLATSIDEPTNILAGSFNAIAAGKTNNAHWPGTNTLMPGGDPDPVYLADRIRPDVVSPNGTTSIATANVSALAVLMVEVAHKGELTLSNGFRTDTTLVGPDYDIYHGETPEVVKAVLMAGADRSIFGSPAAASSINNLNPDRGAGEIDALNSYLIMAGGEQDPGDIDQYGWDYNPSITDDQEVYYTFKVPDASASLDLFTTLTWHLDVTGDFTSLANINPVLHNLDMYLYEIIAGSPVEIDASISTLDNTENFWYTGLTPGSDYVIRVLSPIGQPAFDWDYGIAWRLTGEVEAISQSFSFENTVPEPTAGVVIMLMTMVSLSRRRPAPRQVSR